MVDSDKPRHQGRIPQPPVVLTIAGSDSGGAAGLQADIKTLTSLGVYGTSVITAVTAQNSTEITEVQLLSPALVSAQIEAVLSDYGAQAVKSGFIGSAKTVNAVSSALASRKSHKVVVDPVLVDHRGNPMFDPAVAGAYIRNLIPIADLVTPNLPEAQLLVGFPINSLDDIIEAAQTIENYGAGSVLIKGLREADQIMDMLITQGSIHKFHSKYIDTPNTHGSGDALSAAICAYLARGVSLTESVGFAHSYTNKAIENASGWQLCRGHGPLYHGPNNLS